MDGINTKIPLPQFLKMLSSNDIPIPKAMSIAGKLYKDHNTPRTLAQLSDMKLKDLGVDSPEDRKLLMSTLAKAGYLNQQSPFKKKVVLSPEANVSHPLTKQTLAATSSHPTPMSSPSKPSKRKRILVDEFILDKPTGEDEENASWDFNEVTDEADLRLKSCVINRAPVMMAWSMLIAERIHFSRAEALSIASVYTEMNAVTKGVSLGIYKADEERGREATKDGSQPYVELIGRKPLYQSKKGGWRALSNAKPASPNSAFQYITRSFRQRTPFVMGALKLLADSYTPDELNKKAWSLYAEFRPEVSEWGKRSEIHCSKILDLRKRTRQHKAQLTQANQKPEVLYGISETQNQQEVEPERKKVKSLSVEEYEALLDEDISFDNISLDFGIASTSSGKP